jgi:uncharacterized protein
MEHGRISLPEGLTPERLRKVSAHRGARNVRVFGSVACGTVTEGSDLDLLVDMEPGRDLLDLAALKREIEETLGRGVDVLTENSLSLPTCVRESCAKRFRFEREARSSCGTSWRPWNASQHTREGVARSFCESRWCKTPLCATWRSLEAAKNLSPAFRVSHSEVPWADMAGTRDVLIHRYSAVDLEIV